MENYKKYVIDSFSTDNSIKKYLNDTKNGLWESEKILIKTYFKPNTSVLDLGCGIGRSTFPLAKLGYKVTGVDVTPKFIELAREISHEEIYKSDIPIHFEIGDATDLKYESNSFDNILFSFNGWSMIPTKEARYQAAKEIYRTLKPNGYFIFSFHKRHIAGNELMWLIQLIKLKVIKPLGFFVKETDFGDFYFRKDSETTYPLEQFVSFLNVSEVENIYKSLGFKIELTSMRSEITTLDNNLKSGDVMFLVCKKV